MDNFTKMVESKISEYGVLDYITEDDGIVTPPPAVPEPTINGDPNVDVGATQEQKPVYSKPYQQLAEIMYGALRRPFETLSKEDRYQIETANAENIADDHSANKYFTMIQNILSKPVKQSFGGVVEQAFMEADANNGGAMGDGQMDAEMPSPTADPGTTPEAESGEGQEPMFDMPYPDLARLLDVAIKGDFKSLESSAQRKLQAFHPDDFKDDQQGVEYIKAYKSIVDDDVRTDAVEDSVESGGGVGPAAG
jgi:hypothetical protein